MHMQGCSSTFKLIAMQYIDSHCKEEGLGMHDGVTMHDHNNTCMHAHVFYSLLGLTFIAQHKNLVH